VEHLLHVLIASLSLYNHCFTFPSREKGIRRSLMASTMTPHMTTVLKMSVGILVRLATKWASMHHVDETRFEFEVHVPHSDVWPSVHVGGGGDGKVTESLFGHRLRRRWCLNDWFSC
jgi:hypothetical protein